MAKTTRNTRRRELEKLTEAISKLIDQKIYEERSREDRDSMAGTGVYHAQQELDALLVKLFVEDD